VAIQLICDTTTQSKKHLCVKSSFEAVFPLMALKEKVGREMAENTTLTTESEDDHSIEEQSEASDLLDYEDKSKEELIQEAIEYREALEKRGVIYMSRVPPFMKPNKARSIFEQYGEVTRLFLAEEGITFSLNLMKLLNLLVVYYYNTDAQHRKKRKEHGGNASKQFCEGIILHSHKGDQYLMVIFLRLDRVF